MPPADSGTGRRLLLLPTAAGQVKTRRHRADSAVH